MIFETARLIIRPLIRSDAEATFILDHEPGVNTFTGDSPSANVEEERAMIEVQPYWFAIILKESGVLIGWAGIRDHELVARFSPSVWGKGIWSEAAPVIIKHGFDSGLEYIRGEIEPGHVAARRVVEKLGFVHVSDTEYQLRRSDYLSLGLIAE